jgi:hypothetical protein
MMSVNSYLIDKEKGEYFDLGTGYWSAVFYYDNEFILNKKVKAQSRFNNIIIHYMYPEYEEDKLNYDDEAFEYWLTVAHKIYNWCKDRKVYLSSDCNEETNSLINNNELKEFGTRYND